MQQSMSRKGNCWDNAVSESFFATLKKELVRDRVPETRVAMRAEVFEYIEVFHNRRRAHSLLDYETPDSLGLLQEIESRIVLINSSGESDQFQSARRLVREDRLQLPLARRTIPFRRRPGRWSRGPSATIAERAHTASRSTIKCRKLSIQ